VAGATGSESWPMVGYTYFAVRKNTLRPNTTCSDRLGVMVWLDWFYSSSAAQTLIANAGMVSLSLAARNLVLSTISNSLYCVLEVVLPDLEVTEATPEGIPVKVQVSAAMASIMSVYGTAYDQYESVTFAGVSTTVTNVAALSTTSSVNSQTVYVVHGVDAAQLQVPNTVLTLPFAGLAWGVLYNLCNVSAVPSCNASLGTVGFTLDVLKNVLFGNIVTWNDERIRNTSSHPELLPNEPIVVVGFDEGSSDYARLQALFTQRYGEALIYYPPITVNDSTSARAQVTATQFSLTVVPLNINDDTSVTRPASLVDASGGLVVQPSFAAIQACAAGGHSSAALALDPSTSTLWGCWPFVEPFDILVTQAYSDDECQSRIPQASINFVNFLLTSSAAPLEMQGLAALINGSTTTALEDVSCFGRSITNTAVDYNYIPSGLVFFTWFLSAIIVVASVLMGVWIWQHRRTRLVNAATPVFMIEMLFGCILQAVSIIPLTMQESILDSPAMLDQACMAFPWLLVVGFLLVYTPLLAKAYRIHRLFTNYKMRKFAITNTQLLGMQIIGMAPIVGLMIFWQVYDPFVRFAPLRASAVGARTYKV